MRIELSGTSAHLHEAADLQRLSVVAAPGTDLRGALGDLGRPDDDGAHVWLHVTALREAGAAAVSADARDDWSRGFDAMIAYATSKGWTDPARTSVRAHVETA